MKSSHWIISLHSLGSLYRNRVCVTYRQRVFLSERPHPNFELFFIWTHLVFEPRMCVSTSNDSLFKNDLWGFHICSPRDRISRYNDILYLPLKPICSIKVYAFQIRHSGHLRSSKAYIQMSVNTWRDHAVAWAWYSISSASDLDLFCSLLFWRHPKLWSLSS